MVGMHPKIVGITSEVIRRTVKTVMVAEILRREQAHGGRGDMMTWNEEVNLGAVFTDQGPADLAVAGHLSRAVDGLNLPKSAGGNVVDEVATIRCDGERAPGVKDDVDEVIGCVASRKEGGHEIGIEIGTGEM